MPKPKKNKFENANWTGPDRFGPRERSALMLMFNVTADVELSPEPDMVLLQKWTKAFKELFITAPGQALCWAPENACFISKERPEMASVMIGLWSSHFDIEAQKNPQAALALALYVRDLHTGEDAWPCEGLEEIVDKKITRLAPHLAKIQDLFPLAGTPPRLFSHMSISQSLLVLCPNDEKGRQALQDMASAMLCLDPTVKADPMGMMDAGFLNLADALKLYDYKPYILLHRICDGDSERAATLAQAWHVNLIPGKDIHLAISAIAKGQRHALTPPVIDNVCYEVRKRIPGYLNFEGQKDRRPMLAKSAPHPGS